MKVESNQQPVTTTLVAAGDVQPASAAEATLVETKTASTPTGALPDRAYLDCYNFPTGANESTLLSQLLAGDATVGRWERTNRPSSEANIRVTNAPFYNLLCSLTPRTTVQRRTRSRSSHLARLKSRL